MSAADFNRTPIVVLELDFPRCSNDYGQSPCTASGAAGTECYVTRPTCQDAPSYLETTHTYRFCMRSTPMPTDAGALRPYITRITPVSSVIDFDKGVAARAKVTVTLIDPPDTDYEQDPYHATRSAAAGGTFLARLIARNRNYVGRYARIKRGYITPGESWALATATLTSELYIIDAISGPDARGNVAIVLKDPLKIGDRVQIPAPSAGELSAAITSSALSLALKTDQGTGYTTGDYVRIDDEVVGPVTVSTDTLSWASTANRGLFGTTAAAHSVNARVQKCKVWLSASFATVFEEILNDAGILDANIDTATVASECDTWLDYWTITNVCIAEPTDANALLAELLVAALAVSWWSPADQWVTFRAIRPLAPGSEATLTDAANLMMNTVAVSRADDKRLTRVTVNYALRTPTSDRNKSENYARGYQVIDADAETEYGDIRERIVYSRFLTDGDDAAAEECAVRTLALYRDAPLTLSASLDPKDTDVTVGTLINASSARLVDFDGNADTVRMLVIHRTEKGADVNVQMVQSFPDQRHIWITPDAAPDYTSATETERASYGYISDDNGYMSDGTPGHKIA